MNYYDAIGISQFIYKNIHGMVNHFVVRHIETIQTNSGMTIDRQRG